MTPQRAHRQLPCRLGKPGAALHAVTAVLACGIDIATSTAGDHAPFKRLGSRLLPPVRALTWRPGQTRAGRGAPPPPPQRPPSRAAPPPPCPRRGPPPAHAPPARGGVPEDGGSRQRDAPHVRHTRSLLGLPCRADTPATSQQAALHAAEARYACAKVCGTSTGNGRLPARVAGTASALP